eukprot:Skav220297  [mRNA]  locus=scaffold2356:69318:70939:+ [translate_table: standard]
MEEAATGTDDDDDESDSESVNKHLERALAKRKQQPAKASAEEKEDDSSQSDEEEEEDDGEESADDESEGDPHSDDSEESESEDGSSDEEELDQEAQPVTVTKQKSKAAKQDEEKKKSEGAKEGAAEEEKGTGNSLALVAQSHETSTAMVRNSVTHKKEWDSFSRAIANKKAFPADLAPYLIKSKNDLFGAWLDSGRSWDMCRLTLERSRKASNEAASGWIAVKGRQLIADYGDEKGKTLMDRRYRDGLFYDSEDFPDDPLERMYYMRKAREVTKREVTEEKTKLKGEVECDDAMVRALVGEDGVLQAGQLPNMKAANASGQKALLDGLAEESVVAKKAKRNTTQQEGGSAAEAVEPETMIQKASNLMTTVLSESTTARKKSMALGAVNYAGELSAQLLDHAQTMEKHYKTLQSAVSANLDDDDFYRKAFKKIEQDRQWFSTAEARCFSKITTAYKTKWVSVSSMRLAFMITNHFRGFTGTKDYHRFLSLTSLR